MLRPALESKTDTEVNKIGTKFVPMPRPRPATPGMVTPPVLIVCWIRVMRNCKMATAEERLGTRVAGTAGAGGLGENGKLPLPGSPPTLGKDGVETPGGVAGSPVAASTELRTDDRESGSVVETGGTPPGRAGAPGTAGAPGRAGTPVGMTTGRAGAGAGTGRGPKAETERTHAINESRVG